MSRVVVALGGNALAPGTDPFDAAEHLQVAEIVKTSEFLAEAIADGHDVIITHGNGPQVGNLLAKNEIARDVVPAVSLHWCVAQTQATIGLELAAALETHLSALGVERPVLPVLTRVQVDAADPAFESPSKPIGAWIPSDGPPDRPLPAEHRWAELRPGLWRRLVPSPQPQAIIDDAAIEIALDAGGVVVACGGGGVPVVADGARTRGIEAVIDKDLTAVLLAKLVGADRFVILTDVEGAAVDYGTSEQRFLGKVDVAEMRRHLADGQFGSGSMKPKVEAAIEFVEATSAIASIGRLDDARAVINGGAGTQVEMR
ncbi:MAG: carbamate kinase [Actinomycetota bacterium]